MAQRRSVFRLVTQPSDKQTALRGKDNKKDNRRRPAGKGKPNPTQVGPISLRLRRGVVSVNGVLTPQEKERYNCFGYLSLLWMRTREALAKP